jgi:hypothetical protein
MTSLGNIWSGLFINSAIRCVCGNDVSGRNCRSERRDLQSSILSSDWLTTGIDCLLNLSMCGLISWIVIDMHVLSYRRPRAHELCIRDPQPRRWRGNALFRNAKAPFSFISRESMRHGLPNYTLTTNFFYINFFERIIIRNYI